MQTDNLDFWRSLLEQPVTKVREKVNLNCECGSVLVNGYCRNNECSVDLPIETFSCEFCGHCEKPGHCPQSVACPVCYQSGVNLCKTPTGGVTGFHEERWLLASGKN